MTYWLRELLGVFTALMAMPVEAIWSSAFIVGAGSAGGVNEPWENAAEVKVSNAADTREKHTVAFIIIFEKLHPKTLERQRSVRRNRLLVKEFGKCRSFKTRMVKANAETRIARIPI